MIISVRPLYLVAGLVVTLLVGGCATTYWLSVKPTPPKIQKRVHPGDRVIITTKAKEHYTLEVTQVTWVAVIGTSTVEMEKEITVPFEQIETIEVADIVTAKQQLAGGVVQALVAVLVLLVVLAFAA